MNIFNEIQHGLSSKTRIRSLFKDIHAEDLEAMISRMSDILEEKKEARAKEAEKMKAKKDSINAIKQIMAEHGVSINDLGELELDDVAPKRRRNIQKYVFAYESKGGDRIEWQGATTGRLPSEFDAYLKRTGKSRLDCAVMPIE